MTPDEAIWWLKLKAKQKQKEGASIFQGHPLPVTDITAEPIGKGKYLAEFDKQNPRQEYKETNEYIRIFQPEKVVQKQAWRDAERNRLRNIYAESYMIRDKVKATLNPKNWGVPDYSDKGDFGSAYSASKKAGEKEFMWNNKRFNTDYDGTPSQQLKETGITNTQLQNRNFIQERLSNNLAPYGYNQIVKRLNNAIIKNIKDTHDVSNGRLDAFNIYMGKPQKNNTFSVSNYIPTKSKDNNITYFKLNNEEFEKNLINLVSEEKDIESYLKFIIDENLPSAREDVMGRFYPSVGEDNNGKYIAYYDKWDLNPLNLKNPITKEEITTDFGKPFEIYNRVYYRDNPKYNELALRELKNKIKEAESLETKYDEHYKPYYVDKNNKKIEIPNEYLSDYINSLKNDLKNYPNRYIRQYYSDKELSELDINKKNFDTLALQRELSNRGYKLPKSTKEDGTFDGIWGDETKNALLDYQIKNK